MDRNEKAIVRVTAKENDTTAVMKEVHKASDIEENDIVSIKTTGDSDEILMLGKVLAYEVEKNSENWNDAVVQEAESIKRKINDRCM